MLKSIFVPLFGVENDRAALDAALAIARLFDARLDCLHAKPDPRAIAASVMTAGSAGGGIYSNDIWVSLIEADKRLSARAKATFEQFAREKTLQPPHVPFALSAAYREIEGDPARLLSSNARFSDLSVFVPFSVTSEVPWGPMGDTLTSSGRPVLLVPSDFSITPAPVLTIAWKETAESARAVAAAMPLFAKAKQVNVLSASEDARPQETRDSANALAELLRGHGFNAQAECVECDGRDAGPVILERAMALESSCLVMGAYGHSRVRQFIFGGFTQHMLRQAKLPVFLQH